MSSTEYSQKLKSYLQKNSGNKKIISVTYLKEQDEYKVVVEESGSFRNEILPAELINQLFESEDNRLARDKINEIIFRPGPK